ncbi:DUF4291 family protein [Streptomyces mirabilis]|uniref:DUF4291 family protein n=1 Tax=Streptomyces mirabilis TaxID=68239 RepID=UPI0036BC0B5C
MPGSLRRVTQLGRPTDGRLPHPRRSYVLEGFVRQGQGAVLAVELSREGFEWALEHACLSHYERGLHSDRATWKRQLKRAPARVQQDPELITDTAALAHEIHRHVRDGDLEVAQQLLPQEPPYPVPDGLLDHLRPMSAVTS